MSHGFVPSIPRCNRVLRSDISSILTRPLELSSPEKYVAVSTVFTFGQRLRQNVTGHFVSAQMVYQH